MRRLAAASLATLLAAVPAVVLADQVANNIDATVDATYEVMSLQAGGATGSTNLYVVPTGSGSHPEDGKAGCNLTGQTVLTVAVNSSNTGVATVSPSSVTFSSCGDVRALTVTPVGAGSATVSLVQTANTTDGTFDLSTATFTVDVAAAANQNTAPVVVVTGVTAGASYQIGTFPAAGCHVTDAEDGTNTTFAATLSAITGPLSAYNLGAQTATCSWTDSGGLTTTTSATYAIVDGIAPTLGHLVTGGQNPGFAPWYASATVTIHWSASDNVALDAAGVCADVVINDDVAGQDYSCTVHDVAGNAATDSVKIWKDSTAPTITPHRSVAPNSYGWNKGEVDVSFDCADNLSGVLTTPVTVGGTTYATDCSAKTYANETTADGVTAHGQVYDQAGNFAQANEGPIRIDLTDPTIDGAISPAAAATGWWNIATGKPTLTFTCDDSLSGIATCPDPHMFDAGVSQSFSGTAYDKAGNSASRTWSGIDVDLDAPVLNITDGNAASVDICAGAPSRPSFDPTDGTSGIGDKSDSWTTPSSGSGVGKYIYEADATDVAGNQTSETRTYTVAYGGAFSGFLQPVNPNGTSRFKLGSTVPVKFRLSCDGTPISTAIAKLYVAKGDSMPDPGVDEAISTSAATTGNLFRYSDGQYIFNLSTKAGYTNPAGDMVAFGQGTWTLKIGLDDGTFKSVNIQLVK
jgi:hypothetical protein